MTIPERPITDNMHALAVKVGDLKRRKEASETQNQQARVSLRMIRDVVEEIGPADVMPSEDAVVQAHGPDIIHEAEALVEGVRKIAGDPTSR